MVELKIGQAQGAFTDAVFSGVIKQPDGSYRAGMIFAWDPAETLVSIPLDFIMGIIGKHDRDSSKEAQVNQYTLAAESILFMQYLDRMEEEGLLIDDTPDPSIYEHMKKEIDGFRELLTKHKRSI